MKTHNTCLWCINGEFTFTSTCCFKTSMHWKITSVYWKFKDCYKIRYLIDNLFIRQICKIIEANMKKYGTCPYQDICHELRLCLPLLQCCFYRREELCSEPCLMKTHEASQRHRWNYLSRISDRDHMYT